MFLYVCIHTYLNKIFIFITKCLFQVLGFCDGKTVKVMLPAQDHKRVFNGDNGPNTGGMGAYCPCPLIDDEQLEWVRENVLKKTVDGLREENCPFIGIFLIKLMII